MVEFPALLDHGPVWPEYWNKDELEKVKATLPVGKWNAQWMQQPTSEEGAIIKREWWRTYTKDYIPSLQHVIQSYDTAFMKKETSDYSAITTWDICRAPAGALQISFTLHLAKEMINIRESIRLHLCLSLV